VSQPVIAIFTTGGTIDKVYFDALSDYQVGPSAVTEMLRANGVSAAYAVTPLLRKDSLELTDADRALIRGAVMESHAAQVLITHGTDTMVVTAQALRDLPGKTIVLTGALQPATLKHSDAEFNVGFALAAVQCLPPGVYIAMNGQVFTADNVRKDRSAGRFIAD
jgi:L-asparaginase